MSSQERIKMQKITNYNCDGICCQKYCNKKYTHFIVQEIRGMELVLGFCEEHGEMFVDNLLKNQGKCGDSVFCRVINKI